MNRKVNSPIFEELKRDMNFDPDHMPPVTSEIKAWALEEIYPATVGELIGALTPGQEDGIDQKDPEGGSDPVASGGGGGPVPGGPEDSDPMGIGGQDHLGADAGGPSPVPQG